MVNGAANCSVCNWQVENEDIHSDHYPISFELTDDKTDIVECPRYKESSADINCLRNVLGAKMGEVTNNDFLEVNKVRTTRSSFFL